MKFNGFASLLSKVLESRENGLLKNILTGAGLTVASTAVMTTLVNSYIDKAKSDLNTLPQAMLQLMGLSNVDYALSVILSAVVSRVFMNSQGIFVKKISS